MDCRPDKRCSNHYIYYCHRDTIEATGRGVNSLDEKRNAAPGSQPDTAQDERNSHFSETEGKVAESIAQYMQRYPFKKAHELYESVILTMQLLNEVKAAGIKEERAWEVLTLSAAIDCHNRG